MLIPNLTPSITCSAFDRENCDSVYVKTRVSGACGTGSHSYWSQIGGGELTPPRHVATTIGAMKRAVAAKWIATVGFTATCVRRATPPTPVGFSVPCVASALSWRTHIPFCSESDGRRRSS